MGFDSSNVNHPADKEGQATMTDPAADLTGRTKEQDWNRSLVVLDPRELFRECLIQNIPNQRIQMHVIGAASMQEWKGVEEHHPPLAAILFNAGGRRLTDQTIVDEVTHLVSEFRSVPVVVLTDSEDVTDLLKALDCGVRGFIPTSVGIDVCIEAINLAIAGGTFVPASGLFAFRQALDGKVSEPNRISAMFTPRQAAVAKALRQGKPNKIIAYELNMCESTVKVHVRNIMKKLKATNRTEVAYKINGLAGSDARLS